MFLTETQFYVFVCCVAFGGVFAAVFYALRAIFAKIKHKWLKETIDGATISCFAILFVFAAYKLSFPSFRPYMLLGILTGFFAYSKSLYIILAKTVGIFYNRIKNKRKSVGKAEKKKAKT